MARAFYKSGNKTKAADMIEAAEDFSDFDYQIKLKGFTDALKEKL
jgi:peptidoglycan hydrolase CwlO-like protein